MRISGERREAWGPGFAADGHDFTEDEVEFLVAVERFRSEGRRYPTVTDYLRILVRLGYRKQKEADS